MGGDLLLSLLAQLRFPLPVPAMQAAGMYGHVFVNTGNLVQLTSHGAVSSTRQPLEQGLKAFASAVRWSVVGHLRHPPASPNPAAGASHSGKDLCALLIVPLVMHIGGSLHRCQNAKAPSLSFSEVTFVIIVPGC